MVAVPASHVYEAADTRFVCNGGGHYPRVCSRSQGIECLGAEGEHRNFYARSFSWHEPCVHHGSCL